MDSLYLGLASLEDRYRELSIISEQQFKSWQDREAKLEQELQDARRELSLYLMRLGQNQDELIKLFRLSQSQANELAQLSRLSQSQASELDRLGETLNELTDERNKFFRELDEIRQSSTWRLTKPFRRLFDRMRILRR